MVEIIKSCNTIVNFKRIDPETLLRELLYKVKFESDNSF